MDLSVCLVASELFAFGRSGGIGMCTSMLGRGLAARGVDVVVVVPLGVGQDAVEKLDGMTVYGYPVWR